MSDMWAILRRDVNTVRRNVMASLVICGVVLIPLVFTWFNVLASWAPLDNTAGLKVAVASEDQGFDSNLMPTSINIGQEVLSALRANEQLDWVITSKDTAIEGTKSGDYYAAIIIPPTFSQDIVTFYATGAHPTHIDLYSNEKKNPLAPKITDQGAHGVSHQVAQEFTQTLGDVSLGLVSSLNDFMTRDQSVAALQRVEARAGWVESQLHTSAGTARAFAGLLDSAQPLLSSAQDLLNTPLPQAPSISADLNVSTQDLSAALASTKSSYDAVQARVDELFSQAGTVHQDQVAVLNDLASRVQSNLAHFVSLRDIVSTQVAPLAPNAAERLLTDLDQAIVAQKTIEERLSSAANTPSPTKPDLSAIAQAKQALDQARNSSVPDTLESLKESLTAIRGDLSFSHPHIELDTSAFDSGSQEVNELGRKLDKNAQNFATLRKALQEVGISGNLQQVTSLVASHPGELAAALASPVSIEKEEVYPIAAFGVGMAPLYTTLALWVGALLAGVTLKTSVPAAGREARVAYFGHFGLFACIGLAQSTLVGLGLLNFVKIAPAHPLLLMCTLWVSSLLFMLIIYTLVLTFSNAGKALGVLLLVFQISAAGGAYPLEMLPQWFQNLSPWLPATYTIRAFRAATAGTYEWDYLQALGMLLLFTIPTAFLGTVVRKRLFNYNAKLAATLESTHLM